MQESKNPKLANLFRFHKESRSEVSVNDIRSPSCGKNVFHPMLCVVVFHGFFRLCVNHWYAWPQYSFMNRLMHSNLTEMFHFINKSFIGYYKKNCCKNNSCYDTNWYRMRPIICWITQNIALVVNKLHFPINVSVLCSLWRDFLSILRPLHIVTDLDTKPSGKMCFVTFPPLVSPWLRSLVAWQPCALSNGGEYWWLSHFED